MPVNAVKNAIPTIDVSLVTISYDNDGTTVEIGFDTANQIEVEAQTDEQDAVKQRICDVPKILVPLLRVDYLVPCLVLCHHAGEVYTADNGGDNA